MPLDELVDVCVPLDEPVVVCVPLNEPVCEPVPLEEAVMLAVSETDDVIVPLEEVLAVFEKVRGVFVTLAVIDCVADPVAVIEALGVLVGEFEGVPVELVLRDGSAELVLEAEAPVEMLPLGVCEGERLGRTLGTLHWKTTPTLLRSRVFSGQGSGGASAANQRQLDCAAEGGQIDCAMPV